MPKFFLSACSLSLVGLFATLSVQADDLGNAAMGLCEKVKACAMAEIDQQDLTPEMLQMMKPMLDNMCVQMSSKVAEVPTGHNLYKPALACMRSMESMSCQQMQNAQGATTPACQEYEKLAREAYNSQQ